MGLNSGIYRIRLSNSDKVYIGSSAFLSKRISTHLSMLRSNTHHCQHLQRAYNKYGHKGINIDILEYCDSNCLEIREQLFIDWYKELKICYNAAPKSNNVSGYKWDETQKKAHSDRILQMFSNPAKKKIIIEGQSKFLATPESRITLSLAQKKRFSDTEAVKRNGGLIKKFHDNNPGFMQRLWADKTEKIVLVYKDGEKVYEVFNNTCEAGRFYNINDGSIGKSCKKESRGVYKGWVFIYLKDYTDKYVNERIQAVIKNGENGYSKQIYKLDKVTGEILTKYSTFSEAARENKVAVGNLSKAVRGQVKTLGGFKWAFASLQG